MYGLDASFSCVGSCTRVFSIFGVSNHCCSLTSSSYPCCARRIFSDATDAEISVAGIVDDFISELVILSTALLMK
jgi:hypothetical protein